MLGSSLFQSARLKLTAWYVIVILVISGGLSATFYAHISSVLDREYNRIEQRWRGEIQHLPEQVRPRVAQRVLLHDLQEAKNQVARFLLVVNGLIVVIVAGAGYILSGKTLRPIEEAHQEQKRFVGDAAHELRTPLTALKTALEVNILDKKLSAKAKQMLKANLADVNTLQSLIESLLKLARVDDHALQLQPTQLKPIIETSLTTLKSLANKKRVTVKASRLSSQLQVKGDPDALLELMLILLDNAIKYSNAQGQVSLNVEVKRNKVEITVSDQGPGISQVHLPHIFDRFYRVDVARSNQEQAGYGLGLSLAKRIVDQHHGSISASSQLGKGTAFVVALPLA